MDIKGMLTSDPKEQFYSPSKDVLDLWLRLHPKYRWKVAKHAKDLGAAQRSVGVSSKLRGVRLLHAKSKISRVRHLRIGRRPKVLITRASVQAGALYACETDQLTLRQIQELKVISSVALNYDCGPSNRVAAMLFEAKGLVDPKAQYYYRVLKTGDGR